MDKQMHLMEQMTHMNNKRKASATNEQTNE